MKGRAMSYEEQSLFIKSENLETYAESVAHSLKLAGKAGGRAFAGMLRQDMRRISRAYDLLALRWQGIASMPGAVRWLLDNNYIVLREGAAAAQALARGSDLRYTDQGPVLLTLCRSLVCSGGGELTDERISLFLTGFQRSFILSRCELALLPNGLRAALIMRLAACCDAMCRDTVSPETEGETARIFSSLRYLSSCDMTEIIERADFIDRCYRDDPAGIYPLMDEASREYYRRKTSQLAKKQDMSEYKTAQLVMSLSRQSEGIRSHVGYWLLRRPLGGRPSGSGDGLYIGGNILLTVFISLFAGFAAESAAAFFLFLLPASQLVKSVIDLILLHTTPCAFLPRLDLSGGVPDNGRTLCVISCIITDEDSGRRLAARLEEYRICSRDCGKNLAFALLADLPDTDGPLPEGERWVEAAASAVDALNGKYGGGFLLLTRPRIRREGRYMGWERKRGALTETMRFLRHGSSGIICRAGDAGALSDTRYILTLDSDTRLTPGSAAELIGAAVHPLNYPHVDPKKRIVTSGHGIISPRISPELSACCRSDFTRIFAGIGGTDPYSSPAGEVYMDNWSSGGFAGKGIIHIDSFLQCMDGRIPEGRVLSHDAVEGAFLRGGYMSGTELTDGFPATPLSYYKRLHRWIRGDWQNLPWAFGPGRGLPDIERFRLLDSVRRSLVPIATLTALCLAFFIRAPWAVMSASTALLSCVCSLVITACEALLRSDEESGMRFHSNVFIGIGGGLVRTLLQLILLPVEAFISLDAVFRALWRMCISHKRLLQWQTAGQSDAVRSGPLRCLAAMWPASVLGIALLLWGSIIGRAAGFIWLLSPLCAYILGLGAPERPPVSDRDRAYLLECARDIWKYFDRFLCPEDNFLPPDNYQSRPDIGQAHRTSPTNIGMALISVLAACDLGIAEENRCMELIGRCLDTASRLPKWKGHLYNWYDTRTLSPLSPRYVSTVDSGNLFACLAALRAGLEEYGRPELARQAGELMSGMDFSPLYDRKRRLFHIGIDIESHTLSPSWYDLLSSEARLTGYIAIAKGDVPRKHWRRLSRAQVQKNGYRGMASWTGTMFEYLMPELLLPLYKDSLLYESARFCVYVQRRRTSWLGLPWGVSESAFYSLDPSMSYRYKAHGCAALALKPGMDDELVVSPYSSFLALTVQPGAAVRNLRRLDERGLRGPFGFWEALDFTPSRCPDGSGSAVRCVMSHHLGMSMAAIANCLKDDIMPRRLMSWPEARAYSGLLQERLPLGGAVLRRKNRDTPVKPARSSGGTWSEQGAETDFLSPSSCLLASQVYSLLFTESGISRPLWGRISPYVPPRSIFDSTHGADIFLRLGGECIPLLPDIRAGGRGSSWKFTGGSAEISTDTPELSASVTVRLPKDEPGEIRTVELAGTCAAEGELVLRFSPLLASYADYANHPAFYKLGLSLKVRDGCLVVRRLPRGRQGELFLCLAADRPCTFKNIPGADSGRLSSCRDIDGEEYFLTETLTECSVPIRLDPGISTLCTFSMAMAHSEAAALASALRGLDASEDGYADLPLRACSVLGMDVSKLSEAWALLTPLCFPAAPAAGPHRREELWKFGISGDMPIICAEYEAPEQLNAARELMDMHLLICGCGCDFDLVFISHDGASYHKPLNSAINELLWRNGGDLLSGVRGGVHIIEDLDGAAGVRACAVMTFPLGAAPARQPRQTAYSAPFLPAFENYYPAGGIAEKYWAEDGSFSFGAGPALPPRMWSSILTNGRLGYIAADCGGGNMWYLNSRENQLSPWLCRPASTLGCEALFVSCAERTASAFAAPGEGECRVSFGFGWARWEKSLFSGHIRTTAFVAPDTDARVFIIDCQNLPDGAVLHWRMELQLSSSGSDSRYTVTSEADGLLTAENDRAMAHARPLLAASSPAPSGFTCDMAPALRGDYDGQTGYCAHPVFAMSFPARGSIIIVCGCAGAEDIRALTDEASAMSALEKAKRCWRGALPLRLRSPSPQLDALMNGWAGYQAMACRIMGRCSIYQSGGAYGFRDQLQDTVNLMLFDSSFAREQILRSCRRQYTQGDVQHWWHEGGSQVRGVRTRCSDDLLWLPWSLCEYVDATGDRDLCLEECRYLVSAPLRADEHDRYEAAVSGDESGSVLDHCRRALAQVLSRGTGEHGLLLFGSGDWNDGMDRVGGESVWLTWFFCITAGRFAALAESFEHGSGRGITESATALLKAADAAWDGEWFLRGYFADGSPLGAARCGQCRIDSIAQSFAALGLGGDTSRVRLALDSAVEQLYDRKHDIVKLFTPPFSFPGPEAGYIASYGPGFRENGGQYTHGALWLVLALLRTGDADRAWQLLSSMLPGGKDTLVYKGEPFVISADVYAAPGHEGEAGWTWYTGSAGWMLRIVTAELLGLHMENGLLYIRPRLPHDWPGCDIEIRSHRISVTGSGITVDGRSYNGEGLSLF